MARFRHSEVEALSEILLELYSPCSYTDFPARLFALLRRCFSFDFFDYHEIANNRNERNFVYPESRPRVGVFEAYLRPHCSWTALARKRARKLLWQSQIYRSLVNGSAQISVSSLRADKITNWVSLFQINS